MFCGNSKTDCGASPVPSDYIDIYNGAYIPNNCEGGGCLATTIYHELLHAVGLSHDDPGDPVNEAQRVCIGNLCK